MRLINIHHLTGGEIIAQDICTEYGGVFIKANTRFRPTFKEKLLDRNITDIYIEDELSKGIVPKELISRELKQTLSNNLANQFGSIGSLMHLNIEEIYSIQSTLINAIDTKDILFDIMDLKRNDSYTYSHCLNVAIISYVLATKLQLPTHITSEIVVGALLHDIGKMIIPKDILNKPGKLTAEEQAIMKSHSQTGYDLIKNDSSLSAISKVVILCHHEREDGQGYPLGKKEELHISAKIVAVADVFDALISDRPYRNKFPIDTALKFLKQEKLDLDIITCLENTIAFYPVGCTVLLNNHCVALVEQNFSTTLSRPIVRIILNLKTNSQEQTKVNLQNEPSLFILKRI